MYKIKKVINNNAVLITDPNNEQEMILMGNGIGYNRHKGEMIEDIQGCKQYVMNTEGVNYQSLVDPIYLKIASLILDEAEKQYDTVNRSIEMSLADHIAFALERIKDNVVISNPFTKDIEILFEKENRIAQIGRKIIEDKTGVLINDDEVSYITLHIHNAISYESVSESMKTTLIINTALEQMAKTYHIPLDKNSLSYSRLLIHLKYMFARLQKGERLNVDMDEYMSKTFALSYEIARNICDYIKKNYDYMIPFTEVGYLAIHIERIRKETNEKMS